MNKQTLRNTFQNQRDSLSPAQVQEINQAVCLHLARWPLFQQSHTVLAYLAFRNEISLQPLLDGYPEKIWAIPRTLPAGRMTIHRYQNDGLIRHPWGMLEPSADTDTVPLQKIELILVPGVAFDLRGGRLGFGGGYYDRLLPQLNAPRVGIAYPGNIIPSVPTNEHDGRMDWLVRPEGVVKIEGA